MYTKLIVQSRTTATLFLGNFLKYLGLAVWAIFKPVPAHCTTKVHHGLRSPLGPLGASVP